MLGFVKKQNVVHVDVWSIILMLRRESFVYVENIVNYFVSVDDIVNYF